MSAVMLGWKVTARYVVRDRDRRHALFARSIPYETQEDAEADRAEVLARGDLSATTTLASCSIEPVELESGARYRSRIGALERVS